MATYTPQQLGITASTTGGQFQNGAWYGGRQYMNGTLGEVNQIHPDSPQQGAGQQVSQEVQNQSAKAQGVTPQQFGNYLTEQATKAGTPAPTTVTGSNQAGATANAQASGLGGSPTSTTPTSSDVTAAQAKITDIQNQITAKQQAAADAEKTENDNPFYSESTRVGRIAKITDALNADLTPLNQQLAAAQANYDTAVKAATPNTEVVQSTDNNGNLTLVTVDKNTGNILSTQTMKGVGKETKTGTGLTGSVLTGNIQEQFLNDAGTLQWQTVNGTKVGTFPQLVMKYAPYMTLQDIYKLYAESTTGKKYGTPTESAQDIQQIYNYYSGKPPSTANNAVAIQ